MRSRYCLICGGPLPGKKRHGFVSQDGKGLVCTDWKMPDGKLTRHQIIRRKTKRGLSE